jgi:hypothetical protein
MAAHHTRGECRHVQVRREQRDALREARQESGGGEGAAQQASHPLRKGFFLLNTKPYHYHIPRVPLYTFIFYGTHNCNNIITVSGIIAR